MAKQLLAIRADASVLIGTGHIRRMSILSDYLLEIDIATVLLCDKDTKNFLSTIDYSFENIHVLKCESDGPKILRNGYNEQVKGVFFDHYGLGSEVHKLYRKVGSTMIAIDDMADRYLDVDVLFDGNLGRTSASYSDLLPLNCKRFVGSKYQIIKPVFYAQRSDTLKKRRNSFGKINNIFVCMGGTDALGNTLKTLTNVSSIFPEACIDVAVGSSTPNLLELKNFVELAGPRVNLHVDAKNIVDLMCKADLGVGAGGTMTWERNCVGLPSIMLIIADNQELVGCEMKKAQAAIVIDAKLAYPKTAVLNALVELKKNPGKLKKLGENAEVLCAENGAALIAKITAKSLM